MKLRGQAVSTGERWGGLREDGRLRSGRTGIHWRPAWIWPEATEVLIREQIEDVPRPVIHVCSGSSTLGDVTMDLHHPRADVHADARCLPLADESAGCVVMDPPWTIQDLRERHRFVCEAGRVLQVGGVLLLYGPWMPRPTWATLEDCWVRNQSRFRLPGSAITVTRWRKVHCRRSKHGERRKRGRAGSIDGPDGQEQQRLTEVTA